MTNQPTTPPTEQQLDDIEARAAALYEYATVTDPEGQAALQQLTDEDVPGHVAEVRRLRAVVGEDVIRKDCDCRGVVHADECEVYLELLRTTEPTPEPPMGRLAARWEQLAEQGDKAIGHFEGPTAVTLNAEVEERGRVYRQAAADLREALATGRLPRDLMIRAERASAPAAVETGE
ncbi:hypothetical protein [Streptomyces spinosisporus]|uniref:Uncharacterized protein n=1 Tax=Streptomyces spinosisporus TaxID=2927582 RepID=A0ABS9XWP5_9ACTN|nr:hypothetical protein [Streptomyces spinosisporus]MCI3246481.1 hypothetical protein [Streptomyces spinosisporus]